MKIVLVVDLGERDRMPTSLEEILHDIPGSKKFIIAGDEAKMILWSADDATRKPIKVNGEPF